MILIFKGKIQRNMYTAGVPHPYIQMAILLSIHICIYIYPITKQTQHI